MNNKPQDWNNWELGDYDREWLNNPDILQPHYL